MSFKETLDVLVKKLQESCPNQQDIVARGSRMIIYPVLGVACGALAGEILDRLPYVSTGIPSAFEMLASLRTNSTSGSVYQKIYGNLDKLGMLGGLMTGVMWAKSYGENPTKKKDTVE